MKTFFWQNLPTHVVGAMLIALGTAAAPLQAATLTGYKTYGDSMAGMRVTVGFLDGTFDTATWKAKDPREGRASGKGWSLSLEGDSFEEPWKFKGDNINFLSVNATYGNAVFDILKTYEYTPGSYDGKYFRVEPGYQPADKVLYTDPITSIQGWSGDLYGTLSAWWYGGFSGTVRFYADTDSGRANDPIQPVPSSTPAPTPTPAPPPPPPPEVAPTLLGVDLSNYVINEGDPVTVALSATDPNPGPLTFLLNDGVIATNPSNAATASVTYGPYGDEGNFSLTGKVQDSTGLTSNTITRNLTVLNVAPTINSLTPNLVINEGDSFTYAGAATDPGIYDVLTYKWDLNGDGQFDTADSSSGQYSFADEGSNNISLQVDDGDGGYDSDFFNVTVQNVAPTITSLTQDLVINEGQWFDFSATATDPGVFDQLAYNWDLNNDGLFDYFDPNGQYSFGNNGSHLVNLQVADGDGGFDYGAFNVIVQNVAPTITSLTTDQILKKGDVFNFAATATDAGLSDQLTYEWDFDNDGVYDWTGSSGEWVFDKKGVYSVAVRVFDGDDYTYGSLKVETVPEPSSVLGMFVVGTLGIGSLWKRKPQRKD